MIKDHKLRSTKLENIPNIFLTINFNAQKSPVNEMVFLSTHNICFGSEIGKINFQCNFLSCVKVCIYKQSEETMCIMIRWL